MSKSKSSRKNSSQLKQYSGKQNSNRAYLIQNQNEVLKLKNYEMDNKIMIMHKQLKQHTERVVRYENDVENIRQSIKNISLTEDLKLELQRKTYQNKLTFVQENINIQRRKISEARHICFLEEEKLPKIEIDKINSERLLWQAKVQKEGTTISFNNIQQQLQRIKNENQELVSKRKNFAPKETQLSSQVQALIKIAKENKQKSLTITKRQVAKVINIMVLKIKSRVCRQAIILTQRSSLIQTLLKKKIFMLSLIRKKYLNFIKINAFQCFRKSFQPLVQIEKTVQIIQFTRKRRIKNQMFRIWRSQSAKAEFSLIKRFQVQNTLEKLFKSVLNSNLISAFSTLKYYKNNSFDWSACSSIASIMNKCVIRSYSSFMCAYRKANMKFQMDQYVEENSNHQAQLLIKSMFFGGWAKLVQSNKVVNKTIKYRYFKELKKLVTWSCRRKLGEMLTITNERIVQIDIISKCFAELKKQTVHQLLEGSFEQKNLIKNKVEKAEGQLEQIINNKKQLYQEFSLIKVSFYLKRQMQKSFDLWRNWNKKCLKLQLSLTMLNEKLISSVNLAFYQLQKKRFQKLKLSISQKIKSCEFSYNYLVEQNGHIKKVLDKKQLQLERSKFLGILQRLIRTEANIKHKYFFQFLKSGLKCWRFKKVYQRVDFILSFKLKKILIFLLKNNQSQNKYQEKIEYQVMTKEQKIEKIYMKKGFQGLLSRKKLCKKIKRVLSGIFQRNLELDSYNFYNKMKKITSDYYQAGDLQIYQEKNGIRRQKQTKIAQTEEIIATLTERLKYKENSFANRKMVALKIFFMKNASISIGKYIKRWRQKVQHQKKLLEFAQVLERKTRIMIHRRFVSGLQRKLNSTTIRELQNKADKFVQQLENDTKQYQRFIEESKSKSEKIEVQNEQHKLQTIKLEKVTDRMDLVKIASFQFQWKKKIVMFVMREWKNRLVYTKQTLNKMIQILLFHGRNEYFKTMKNNFIGQKSKLKIRTNLSHIYAKNYRHNMGLMMKIWRTVNWNKKILQKQQQFQQQNKSMQRMENIYYQRNARHLKDADFRVNDKKIRKIFDFMKKFSRMRITVKQKKASLQKWLKVGYQIDFISLLGKFSFSRKKKSTVISSFQQGQIRKRAQIWFNRLKQIVTRKHTIKRLFINKFISYEIFRLTTQFLSRIKNYHHYIVVSKKDRRTFCIQKVIETFQKKRKDTLCRNIRRWRRNLFEMQIQYNLFRRLTRKAIYNRYEGCFYSWKRQKQAKSMVVYHKNEGEIKKRKFEIVRLQRFLNDFKKTKGLLLQNQDGDFVVSPRFQQQKEKQNIRDNNLKYRFISRMILSMNGYNPAIKGWNNLQMYAKIRQRFKKGALLILNSLKKPDLSISFKIWHKAAKEFRNKFEIMDRKALIKILTNQKDKMEIYYSGKLSIQEQIREELGKYKILSYQDLKREKLCALLFNRHARNTKLYSLLLWKRRVEQMKDLDAMRLEERGQAKIDQTSQQVRQLQEDEEYLRNYNNQLHMAVRQALQIAQMVRRITQERDRLSRDIQQKELTSQALLLENQALNSKLYLAQKQAMNLLVLSSGKL